MVPTPNVRSGRRWHLWTPWWLAAVVVASLTSPLQGQRRPVLDQIAVPHNYYFREMYLPQLTTGPGWVTWSPDGRTLIYSMAGSLWRQEIGSDETTQLTDGPGYDYQPDWSPDGRQVVYSSYHQSAIGLRVLDVQSGQERTLVSNGAVNVEPRWSPDGARIAFVSTQCEGRWHVFVVPADGSRAPERITTDHDSALPRYYYSRFDHYLSPSWSPNGRELILVSNAGRIWGSGGFWRVRAEPGAAPELLHHEETTWKARPDWSRDGQRVVYSSYLGRQWNQLWLMPARGGDTFQLTYGEFDATNPRWSPDGTRIAYISNERGNTSLRVVAVPGGEDREVVPRRRTYKRSPTTVTIRVVTGTGQVQPARLSIVGSDGRSHFPRDAWAHADDGFDRSERRFEFTYFHTRGESTIELPAGTYTVEASRGYEYERQVVELRVGPRPVRREVTLRRLVNLPQQGWFSGDLHVHMNYGGHYRNTPERLRAQAEAEDVRVIENLIVNKEQRIPDIAYFRGGLDPASTLQTLIKHDEEYHTSWWGHSALVGLTQHFVTPNYAGYVNTAAASLYPHNSRVAEVARAQGGLFGYVHPFDEAPRLDGATATTHALPVDAALGRLSYMEVVGFSDHLATAAVWYRLLNTGIKVPAGAGTDAMANYASLRGPVGLARVYVKSGRLDYRRWLDGLAAGRTMVTNGPLVGLTLDGREAGDSLALPAAGARLRARVWLRSIVPVDSLQVVSNGRVVHDVPLTGNRTSATVNIPLQVAGSAWFTVRAFARQSRHPVLDLYPFATTSPIYVTVGGQPIRSRDDAMYFVQWISQLTQQAQRHMGWNSETELQQVVADLRRAQAHFQELAR
jgi:Tol biopolymer transport system component